MAILTDALQSGSYSGQRVYGKIGTDSDDDFIIKPLQIGIRLRNPNRETTGDNDDDPRYEAVNRMYCDFVIDGLMLSGSTFVIKELIQTTANTNPSSTAMYIVFGSAQVLKLPNPLVEDIQLAWFNQMGITRVKLVGKTTRRGTTAGTPVWGTDDSSPTF